MVWCDAGGAVRCTLLVLLFGKAGYAFFFCLRRGPLYGGLLLSVIHGTMWRWRYTPLLYKASQKEQATVYTSLL